MRTKARAKTLELHSSAFRNKGPIPPRHTCDGEDLSPPLSWERPPEGTESLALIMEDPDAPPGTWVHWVLYDLPAGTKGLGEGLPKTETLADGSKQGRCWGVKEFSRTGYQGPCPPPGKPHRYVFRLYALDRKLALPPGRTKEEVLKALEPHVLAQGELVGLYQR